MALSLRKKSSTAAAVPAVVPVSSPSDLIVPATSFDFTEGGFGRAERTRRILLGGVLAGAIGVVLIGGGGFAASSEKGGYETATQNAIESTAKSEKILQTLDTAGGFSSEQLQTHVAARTAAKKKAEESQADNVRILNSVVAATPTGVSLQSMTITWVVDNPFSVKPPPSASAAPVPGEIAPSAAPDASAGTAKALSVVATATSFSQIGQFNQNLTAVPGLTGVSTSWSGGGNAWTVNVTAGLADSARGPQR